MRCGREGSNPGVLTPPVMWMRDNRAVRFDFATATEVVFGAGTRHMVAERARRFGASAFVVTGRDAERARWLVDALAGVGMSLRRVAGLR